MTKAELKQQIHRAIDQRAEEIVGLGEQIRKNPELGFKEVKTARLVEETMGRLGLSPKGGLALTGVRADVAGRGGDGPTFALLGELDALVVTGHPVADPRPAPRTPAATTRRWPDCSAPPWACSTPRRSITSPDAWCSSRCPPRSTATSSGGSPQARAGSSSSWGASPS